MATPYRADGLFLFDDDLGLIEIMRTGESLLENTVETIEFNENTTQHSRQRPMYDSWGPLDNSGSVAFRVLFNDAGGQQAIVLFQVVPEPSGIILAALMLATAGLNLAVSRRQR